ncbi:MAG: type II toxin-antitoxin system VapC family toxin [Planctomycetes bacterium]|nr:type II toxin-antitoxin system VapC family toxin [Planctomycetota bacterium]
MPALVADTHALIWWLDDPSRLSPSARKALESACAEGRGIAVSVVSLVEMTYLAEKARLAADVVEKVRAFLRRADSAVVVAPLDEAVVDAVSRVSREEVPELPDRIICATAVHLGIPLVTRDRRIRASQVPTIW